MIDKKKTKECCSREYDRLVDRIADCDHSARDQDEKHLCYRTAAKEGKKRVRQCADAA